MTLAHMRLVAGCSFGPHGYRYYLLTEHHLLAPYWQVNKYPMQRSFTAVGTGGQEFRQAMVAAVERVVGSVHEECVSERHSSQRKYISVTVGPVWIQNGDQVSRIPGSAFRDPGVWGRCRVVGEAHVPAVRQEQVGCCVVTPGGAGPHPAPAESVSHTTPLRSRWPGPAQIIAVYANMKEDGRAKYII